MRLLYRRKQSIEDIAIGRHVLPLLFLREQLALLRGDLVGAAVQVLAAPERAQLICGLPEQRVAVLHLFPEELPAAA